MLALLGHGNHTWRKAIAQRIVYNSLFLSFESTNPSELCLCEIDFGVVLDLALGIHMK